MFLSLGLRQCVLLSISPATCIGVDIAQSIGVYARHTNRL